MKIKSPVMTKLSYSDPNPNSALPGGSFSKRGRKNDIVFIHILPNNHPKLKKDFPISVAVSFDIKDEKLHKQLQKFLKEAHLGGKLYVDSINKGPLKISYGIDFKDVQSVQQIFNQFFNDKKLTSYSGDEKKSDVTINDFILRKAKEVNF